MRIVYLTIDNINDNVVLAQTFPFLARLAALPGIDGIDLLALKKKRQGDRYRSSVPSAAIQIWTGSNHGIWHPLTVFHLGRLALIAWGLARRGTVLIGRNPLSLLCLAPAALWGTNRLVLDYRGLLSEEYVLQGKIAKRGRMHRLLRRLEGWALRRADLMVCVSERLSRRARRWRPECAGKILVVPCCYDPALATRDDRMVERLRQEFGLDARQDFVLTYAGSLSAWNRPEAVLAVFRAFRSIHPRTRLLVLTGDLPAAQRTFGGEPGVILRAVPHGEIHHYLAVADLGLLLRERNSVNRVASPVKFAEYLACGLPVLVSPGVGDFSSFVRTEQVGYVLEPGLPLARVVSEIRDNRSAFRVRCQEVAARDFDGDRYLSAYKRLVSIVGDPMEPLGCPRAPRIVTK
jgi:glycosyltransferase involved in cell wall biosynthesis